MLQASDTSALSKAAKWAGVALKADAHAFGYLLVDGASGEICHFRSLN